MAEAPPTILSLTERFFRALTLANELHAGHLRKGASIPYVSHLLAVAALVLEQGGNEDEAIAALLHDVIEDRADLHGGATALRAKLRDELGDTVVPGSNAHPSRCPAASTLTILQSSHNANSRTVTRPLLNPRASDPASSRDGAGTAHRGRIVGNCPVAMNRSCSKH